MTEDDRSHTEPAVEPPTGERTVRTTGAAAEPPTVSVMTAGSVLGGRYQLEAMIGDGGSGSVFRAWDRALGEPVAVKILRGDRARERSWIKRLAREVKVARAIRHPNVCRVFELGHADGHWFITMELATGGTLRDTLQATDAAARPLGERLGDVRAVCAGLAAIHAVGIVHRDVTPQNVLRMPDGRLVVSDFGLAIEMTAQTTMHGGTPAYMPPETLLGARADQRSDVWQLGAIMHAILFGRRPAWTHDGDVVALTWPLPPDASPVEEELAHLAADCLAPNPARRPPTAIVVTGRLAAAETARPRTPAQRAWLKVRNGVHRHRRALTVGAALILAGGAARAVQVAARPPLCRAGSGKLAGVWDASTKDTIRAAFGRTGKTYAADTYWSVNRLLGRYLVGWLTAYTDACEATHVRGEQSADVLDLRMACLDDRLSGVRSLTQLFTRADGDVVDNAVSAVTSLPTLERCADVRLLRAVVPPPDDPAARDEVDRIRRGLAAAKALHDAGNDKLALRQLAALVGDARRTGYDPVLAEALALVGLVDMESGDHAAAYDALKQALWRAEASRDDELKAQAAARLVIVAGWRERYEEADDWTGEAEAALKRIGGHDWIRAELETNIGAVRERQGRDDESLAHAQRAAAIRQRTGASRTELARSFNNIALVLTDVGRPREALEYFERAESDLSADLGGGHPLVAIALSNEGEALARLGRLGDARAAFERALVSEERAYGKDSSNLGYPLFGLGDAYLREHEPGKAVAPLERAFAIRDARESDQGLIADTAFALARALAASGQQPARAVALATRARAIAAREPSQKARLTEIDGWLAAHDQARNPRRVPSLPR